MKCVRVAIERIGGRSTGVRSKFSKTISSASRHAKRNFALTPLFRIHRDPLRTVQAQRIIFPAKFGAKIHETQ
jgi:hypothetical protein